VTLDDAPTPTRPGREQPSSYEDLSLEPISGTDEHADGPAAPLADDAPSGDLDALVAQNASPASDPTTEALRALGWVDEESVTAHTSPGTMGAVGSGYVPASADLLARRPRRSPFRAAVLVPIAAVFLTVGAYVATTLMWPLHAVAPTISAIEITPAAVPAAAPAWPYEGSASLAIAGFDGTLTSTADADSIASITKVVTALLVLEEMPLAVGEAGPTFAFTYNDMLNYWQYRYRGESALDVPVDGTLTEYQMLQGLLIGSANNYADRLASNLWASDAVFADAANEWLDLHGVDGVTIVEPTGIDAGNTATPAGLITLAQKALADPVIAEIVAMQQVELPGAGLVENTNTLLQDEGVLGIKTGTLDRWNLLSAKQIMVGETPVTMYASVLGQEDDDARTDASRAIYAQAESELQPVPSVTAGTLAGTVETLWSDPIDIVTSGDASAILWNGGAATVTTTYDLGDSVSQGDSVGTLQVEGPLDAMSVELQLAEDIEPPDAWWRMTHPLDLFGLAD
jgi:D-alanyl-D-alanine carboxypeptidase (penicillin-binding protein 5/6)